MKTKGKILLGMLCGVISLGAMFSFAQGVRGGKSSSPVDILDTVKDEANKDYAIQETALDGVNPNSGNFEQGYTMTNTLMYIKNHINPYLQWMLYIGLSLAAIGLIYNGFLMVTDGLHGEGKLEKVKKNITHIVIGVILITGFYGIVRLILAVLNMMF